MTLVSILLLTSHHPPGLPTGNRHWRVIDGVLEHTVKWRVLVRGPRVIFESPPGWKNGEPPAQWKGTERTWHEVPRNQVLLTWKGADLGDVERWPAKDGKS